MAETLGVILAYVLTFGIPMMVIGIGSMCDERKMSTILSSILLVTFLGYYLHTEVIPFWILGTIFIIISFIFVIMFKSILGGGD